jgi:hypothetical protein
MKGGAGDGRCREDDDRGGRRRVLREEHGDVIRESVRAVARELMEVEVVRHEALSDRAGCETPLGAVAAVPRS